MKPAPVFGRWVTMLALLASVAAAHAASETSLERWSTVEIREATEAIEKRWKALSGSAGLSAAPDAMAAARRAVDEALSGRRWHDDRERVYWIYQAERTMDYAELAATIARLERDIDSLEGRRVTADEVRIREEVERRAAAREAELRRREAELARREAELALAAEAAAAERERQTAAPARVRTLPLLEDLRTEAPTLPVEATRRGPMLVLGDLLFEVAGTAPESRARSQLETLFAYLDMNRDVSVSVEGHWDTVSDPADADRLAKGRADAVRTFLLGLGIAPDRISSRGFGGQQPIAPGSAAADHERNRRVELFLAAPSS